MESSPRLGLRTIYIAPLHGRTKLTTKVWVRSFGTIWEGVKHPRLPDRGSTSTYCVLCLNFVKGKFNIHHSRITHTLTSI